MGEFLLSLNYLRVWLSYLTKWYVNRRPVLQTERVSRFVFENSKINTEGIKFRAFLDDEPSVSLTSYLTEPTIWWLGDLAGRPRGRAALARGDLLASAVLSAGASTARDEPPWRHALIRWPEGAIEPRKNVAQRLASAADTKRRA